MPKVLAYYALHYGKEYLAYSLASIYPVVDKIVILYTDKPSYGYNTELTCPDTEEELKSCCDGFWDKIEWKKVWASTEAQHRHVIEDLAETLEFDIILAVDSDEVWDTDSLREAIAYVDQSNARSFRVPFVHFWKSFDTVCRDASQPERFTKLSGVGAAFILLSTPVYHFGYCIYDDLMKYKWDIHGHKPELREGWMEKVWVNGGQLEEPSVHPGNGQVFWIQESFDKTTLPEVMHRHPRYV